MGLESRSSRQSSTAGRLSRRAFLARAALLSCSTPTIVGLLAACGGASPTPSSVPATSGGTAPTRAAAATAAPTGTATTAAAGAKGTPGMTPAGNAAMSPTVPASGGKRYTVTAITFTYGNPPPNDGPGLKMIDERFNIDFQPQFIPQGSYTEKLSAVVSSGDIPDILGFTGVQMPNFYKWAGQGAFLAVDDLVQGYQSFKYVSDTQWNLVRVKGKRQGIPQYYPPYSLTPSIRQDWLDNLGLKMPTSYDELKQVALAFTTNDPAKDGNKHYGIAIGTNINPSYAMGAYWEPTAWYHKDASGKYLPGMIAEASKQRIQFLADLYQQGAITRDFAVMKNWADINKEFYSGKAGIFIGAPRGMSEDYMKSLLDIHPQAKPVGVYPFKAPDGSEGYAGTGPGTANALSAKMAQEPEKAKRGLAMLDFFRKFYPEDQRNPQNADFDWYMGRAGQGYDMVNGKPVPKDSSTNPQGLAPSVYSVAGTSWPPTDKAIEYQKLYTKEPRMGEWAGALQKMWHDTKPYFSPDYGIISETKQAKGGELTQFVLGEQTKMIAGQRAINTWDEMVKEYLAKGGQKLIDETNQGIQERAKGQ